MDGIAGRDDRTEFELDERGTTRVLTDDGWEAADYMDPGDDWSLMPDGSWLSPDGMTRSWPVGSG